MGHATTRLAGDSVDIQLIDPDQWLNSCDDHDLDGGANLALVGNELLQFADVDPLGAGRFRLTRLVRGCGGTESALDDHAVGDLFLLINRASMQPIRCLIGDRESVVTVTQPATGARATTAGRSHKPGAGRGRQP